MNERLVFAYSGGLDAARSIPILIEEHGLDVIAMTLDVGQGGELEEIRDSALAAGAVRAHVLDVRDEFARELVLPALQAGALQQSDDSIVTALAAPIVARKLVEVADIERAAAVAHGGTGAGGARLDRAIEDLTGRLQIKKGAHTSAPGAARVSRNLLGRSTTGAFDGASPNNAGRSAGGGTGVPAHVEISFEAGVPVAINGIPMALTELIDSLAIIAGQHGVGRLEVAGSAASERIVIDAPAAVLLHAAHDELRRQVVSPDLASLIVDLAGRYTQIIHDGSWFTPMRAALDAFTAVVQHRVTGMVRITLLSGQYEIAGASPAALAPASVPVQAGARS